MPNLHGIFQQIGSSEQSRISAYSYGKLRARLAGADLEALAALGIFAALFRSLVAVDGATSSLWVLLRMQTNDGLSA